MKTYLAQRLGRRKGKLSNKAALTLPAGAFLCTVPRRLAVAREHLAQLPHLPAAAIARELGCTPDHVNVLLRQHGLTCAPTGRGRRVGIRFAPGPEQRAVIQQFQASSLLVSGLASAVGCTPARLFDELSGRVPMPEERVAALAQLLTTQGSAHLYRNPTP